MAPLQQPPPEPERGPHGAPAGRPDALGCREVDALRLQVATLERELRGSADLVRLAHDAIFTWTFRGGIETWNLGAEELYGWSEAEALGQNSRDLLGTVFPEPWADVERALRALHLWTGELLHTCRDGRVVTVAAKLQLVRSDDGSERVLEATHDVTQWKRARERAEWIARFPGESPDPVMRLGRDLTVLYANAAAETLLGASVGAPSPPVLADAVRQAFDRGERAKVELALGDVVLAANLVPTGADLNVYAQDMTARKRAEVALAAANARLTESDRRKDEFLAMLSHELRNPLAPIRNAVAILEQASPAGAQAARAKAVIRRQVDHMARLVDDLLDVARIARGKITIDLAPLELVDLVRRSAEDHRPLLYERGVGLHADLPPAPAWIHGDATRLTQVVGNLLQNASKFTERGGQVTVALEVREGWAELWVSDTGIGMDRQMLAQIFTPFVQADRTLARSQGGLGLGLSLVKAIVDLHGGSVRAESEGSGKGSTFVVRLPAGRAPEVGAPRPRGATGRPLRVLVVDDNRDGAESLSEILGLIGHEVEVAFDGPSALELARARPPDVVLCDLGLPGMSGFDVARTLRVLRPEGLRLIALSGYAQPDDVAASREAGFDAHVATPPDPEVIFRLLAS